MDVDQVWIGSTPNRTALRVGLAGRSAGRFRKGPARPSSRSGVTLPAAVPRPAPPRPAPLGPALTRLLA